MQRRYPLRFFGKRPIIHIIDVVVLEPLFKCLQYAEFFVGVPVLKLSALIEKIFESSEGAAAREDCDDAFTLLFRQELSGEPQSHAMA